MRSSSGWMRSGTVSVLKIVTPAPTDKAQAVHRVELQPAGLGYGVAGAEDLLSAAAAAGIQASAACRNGVCEICEATLITGQALNTRNQQTLSVGDRLMMCRRSEEHTSELQSRPHLVCRLLLEKKKQP